MTEAELNETENDELSTDAGHESDEPKGAWCWLLAGIAAAVIAYVIGLQFTGPLKVGLPPEYDELIINDQSQRDQAAAAAIALEYAGINMGRLNAAIAAALAIVFGVTAGWTSKNVKMGIIGGVVGAVLSVALYPTVGPIVAPLSSQAKLSADNGDVLSMLLHGCQWLAIGIPVAVAIGIGTRRASGFGKGLVAMIIGAALGGAMYVLLGGILDPLSDLSETAPQTNQQMLVWAGLAPLIAGLVLMRAKP